nr:MAG TPA: hypothetical protein [Caudoviricetes sp.]
MPTIKIPIWIRSEYVTISTTSLLGVWLTACRCCSIPPVPCGTKSFYQRVRFLSILAAQWGGFFLCLLRLPGGLFVSLDASLNGGLKRLLVRVGGGQLLPVAASELSHGPVLFMGNLRVLLPEHGHAYGSQIGGVVLLSDFVQFIEHFGVHSSISFAVKNMLLFLQLLDGLVDTSCRQTAYNAHGNGGHGIAGREIRHAQGQTGHPQQSAHQPAYHGNEGVVVVWGRLDDQAHQVADDGDRRHARNTKVHIFTPSQRPILSNRKAITAVITAAIMAQLILPFRSFQLRPGSA